MVDYKRFQPKREPMTSTPAPNGGTLTVSATATDGSVMIAVHDTGVGIPHEMKDKLFSPLTTGKAKATGLGLAVVKRIAEAYGGTIS